MFIMKKQKFLLVGIKKNKDETLGKWGYVPLAFFSTLDKANDYALSCCPFRDVHGNIPPFKKGSLLENYEYYDIWDLNDLEENPKNIFINPAEIPFL